MKKKISSRILAMCIALGIVLSSLAIDGLTFTVKAEDTSGTCGTNLAWEFDEDTGILTISGTGDMDSYSPSDTAPWYSLRGDITNVVVEDSVTTIGRYAFYNCVCLISINIADTVTSINYMAFYHCTSLSDITLGDNISSIGNGAFYDCTSLTSMTIPDSVTEIGSSAFESCTNLSDIVIGCNVISIGSFAFYGCTNLTSITIPDSVTEIEQYTFVDCSSLSDVVIGDGVTSIGVFAFKKCTSLTSITIPDSVIEIGEGAFYHCDYLSNVEIGNSVTTIGGSVFYGCTSLTSITIPSSVTSMGGDWLFRDCTELEIIFEGSSLVFSSKAFVDVIATIYYPCDDNTWTESVMQDYGGTITWVANHNYESVTIESTCIETGLTIYTCLLCGETYTEAIAVTGHSYESVVTAPTCTEQGYTTYTCSVCGDSYISDYTAATGHSYAGTNICTVCGSLKSSKISDAEITLSKTSYTYSGSERKPSVTVVVNGTTLTKNTEYTVSYSDNTNAGTATVTITGKGSYSGTTTATFTIKAKSISSATVTLSSTSYTYDGSAKKPSVKSVVLSGTTLSSSDYTVKYASGRKSIGTYKVKVTGKGNYTGTAIVTFTIKPAKVTVSSVKSSDAKKLTVKWSKVSGSVTGYQIRYKKSTSSTWTTVTVKASTLSKTISSLTAGKKYSVQVRAYKTVSGKKYYGSWSSTKSVTVKKAQTLTVKSSSSKTVSYSKVKKAKQTVTAITKVSGAKGTVTYSKSSGKSYFTVNSKTGKITVKKGTPKGTYTVKIKVTSAAKGTYASASKTVTVKIKVK